VNRHLPTTVRDAIALVIVLVVVPLSVFGGTNIACIGQGITQACAPTAVFISPLLLLAAGLAAGLITSGWTGLLVVGVGQIAGQVVIVLLAYLAGRPVPIDLFSAIIATIWFGAPIAAGYAIGRLASRAWRRIQARKQTPGG
jgi:hypothetical protein